MKYIFLQFKSRTESCFKMGAIITACLLQMFILQPHIVYGEVQELKVKSDVIKTGPQKEHKTFSLVDSKDWQKNKNRLAHLDAEKLTEQEDCFVRWKILWSGAKQGNLEARATLAQYAYPNWPLYPQIFFPGRSGDDLSSMRDSLILIIHSSGVKFDTDVEQGEFEKYRSALLKDFFFNFDGGATAQCIQAQSGKVCADFASTYNGQTIKHKLVPTFEKFAEEIDAQVAAGKVARCIYFKDKTEWKKRKQVILK